ncbi:hypothetical protein NHF48_019655 [Sphingomonas sp. H160509]|uniref:hypothetical protein n=1 Tax=Sphingomonas sp. H160509 TaxID=2955313 RepID=UPI0021E98F10|nr:hypothetical protein [Sphingomonas sp. H160509]MDD1452634.1 hypothetical protein [Sphingomonas sp. H160509]
MASNPDRAMLVTQPYRYAMRKVDGTLALYPNSKVIEINTALDEEGGEALAQEIFDQSGESARTFRVTISEAINRDDFIDGPPRFMLNFPEHPAADPTKIYTVIDMKVRDLANRTVLMVRG